MTTTDRLATIRARCVLISQQDYRPDTSLPAGASVTVAMALTCIAQITWLLDDWQAADEDGDTDCVRALERRAETVIAAWEDSL